MKIATLHCIAALLIIMTTSAYEPTENLSTGTMQVMLTDAPTAYESVIIDIEEVCVHIDSDAEEGDSGWRTINDQPKQVDLLDLTNGTTEILGEGELE